MDKMRFCYLLIKEWVDYSGNEVIIVSIILRVSSTEIIRQSYIGKCYHADKTQLIRDS